MSKSKLINNYVILQQTDRENFFPVLVADNMALLLRFENTVYGFMDRYCSEYSGGYFEMAAYGNGAKVMFKDSQKKVKVVNPDNYYSGEMTEHAYSMACFLMACSHMSFMAKGEAQAKISNNYHLLREVLLTHPEAEEIFSFLD